MSNVQLHKVQVIILYALRHNESYRYSDLLHLTDLDSDVFKFHLRKLGSLGYVEKLPSGQYTLTPKGKEFANNLNEDRRTTQKQPKLSIMIIVSKSKDGDSETVYLFQKRARNPYYDFWGCIGGPVQWNEEFEETAQRELKKQTGLTADFKVKSFYRKRDYNSKSNDVLEDKLFVLIEASNLKGELTNTWHGGFNQWMTIEELKRQEKYFKSSHEAIDLIRDGKTFVSRKAIYNPEDY